MRNAGHYFLLGELNGVMLVKRGERSKVEKRKAEDRIKE